MFADWLDQPHHWMWCFYMLLCVELEFKLYLVIPVLVTQLSVHSTFLHSTVQADLENSQFGLLSITCGGIVAIVEYT